MNSKYKIVIIISSLLLILSISLTTVNYFVSLNNTEEQLKNQALPLSLDNIYTEIQKHVIEPYLVSSMMANDTFLHEWLKNEEQNDFKIKQYLSAIKNKYGMFTTFLVAENSESYYTQDGFIEKMSKDNLNNAWYYKFRQISQKHEINLDFNEHLSNSLIMFINYKIFGSDYSYLGATGVGIKISYINDMLKTFRQHHHFKVFFIDEKGKILLAERSSLKEDSIDEIPHLKNFKDTLISKESKAIEYEIGSSRYLLNTKYIPELNIYLLVEAKLDDFVKDVKSIFYFNLFISLSLSLLITIIIIFLIKNYNKKLEYLANNDILTNLNNRRIFREKLNSQILIHQRRKEPLCLVFLDIDNFKDINDKFGHEIGDKVIKRFSSLLKNSLRETDLISRWGGEEFVICFLNSTIENSQKVTEKIRAIVENDYILQELNNKKVTASFGLTQLQQNDNINILINRADKAMYDAKNSGKNRVVVS